MKVLFDHQIFEAQTAGGISRYFSELITHFNRRGGITAIIPAMRSDNIYVQSNPAFNLIGRTESKKTSLFSTIYNFTRTRKAKREIKQQAMRENLNASIEALKKSDFDIFHPTYYSPYFLQYLGNRPFVLTIYDMTYAKFADSFPPDDKTLEQIKLLAGKANMIIAISQSTKNDIVQILKIPSDKIEVIYLGNSITPPEYPPEDRPGFPLNYLLFAGRRDLYKNFDFFISSVAPLLGGKDNLHLVCAGGGRFSGNEKKLLKKLEIKKNVLQFFPENDDELSQYYAKAKALCFPSKYEGFGLPILEAFANGCPVVASNTSSLPEVAGSAALYFDPYKRESILEAVNTILRDTFIRQNLIAAGKKRLKLFSWVNSADAIKNVYSAVLNQAL
ncbi:MAG: glycosyltransferase family 1 protein [bacterium]